MANECIPLYHTGGEVTCQTTAFVTGKTFVTQTGPLVVGNPSQNVESVPIRVATSPSAGRAFGVAVYDAASGARVPVITIKSGYVVPILAGGPITAGDTVESGANGYAVAAAGGSTNPSLGKAVSTSTAAGQDVLVALQ